MDGIMNDIIADIRPSRGAGCALDRRGRVHRRGERGQGVHPACPARERVFSLSGCSEAPRAETPRRVRGNITQLQVMQECAGDSASIAIFASRCGTSSDSTSAADPSISTSFSGTGPQRAFDVRGEPARPQETSGFSTPTRRSGSTSPSCGSRSTGPAPRTFASTRSRSVRRSAPGRRGRGGLALQGSLQQRGLQSAAPAPRGGPGRSGRSAARDPPGGRGWCSSKRDADRAVPSASRIDRLDAARGSPPRLGGARVPMADRLEALRAAVTAMKPAACLHHAASGRGGSSSGRSASSSGLLPCRSSSCT